MHIPDHSHEIWLSLLSGKQQVKLQYLATKMLLTQLQVSYQKDKDKLPELIDELRTFLEKNKHIKKVQEDIKALFNLTP